MLTNIKLQFLRYDKGVSFFKEDEKEESNEKENVKKKELVD